MKLQKVHGRSIPGFDLHEALCEASSYLTKYGGHEMAIGLSLEKKNFDNFCEKMKEIAKKVNIEELIPVIKIDKELETKDLKVENVDSLKLLEPYGEANKMPIFLYKNLKIDSIRALSEGKHLKLTLKDDLNNIKIGAIGFNLGHLVSDFKLFDKIDVVGNLELNEFNGNTNIQINLKDIRKSI